VHQLIFSAGKLVDQAGIEPATFRVSDGCTACRALGRWSPAQESNSLLRFTGAAHRRQCLRGSKHLEPAERIERSSVAYHATALPLSYTGWSRRADSNRHLSVTRAPFFPLNYFDNILGASNRIRTGVRTMARSNPSARRYPRGASGENRTLLACLEGRNSANKSRSPELQRLTFSCQRTHFDGSTWTVRSLQPLCAFTRSFGRQNTLVGHPGFEPGIS
jgi:hypothetical protein